MDKKIIKFDGTDIEKYKFLHFPKYKKFLFFELCKFPPET